MAPPVTLRGRSTLVTVLLLAVAVWTGVGAAAMVGRALGPDPQTAAVRDGCQALVAHRRAETGNQWIAARSELAATARQLSRPRSPGARAVADYTAALSGPPTSGWRLLVSAADACERLGMPALSRDVQRMLPGTRLGRPPCATPVIPVLLDGAACRPLLPGAG